MGFLLWWRVLGLIVVEWLVPVYSPHPTPTHTREFEDYMAREGSKPKFAFKVQVLTTGFWPFYKQLDAVLPPEMQACQKAFQSFYDSKTSHRKLQWVYTLGSATVRCCCFVLGYTACKVQHSPTSLSPLPPPHPPTGEGFLPQGCQGPAGDNPAVRCLAALQRHAWPHGVQDGARGHQLRRGRDEAPAALFVLWQVQGKNLYTRLRRWGCLSVKGGRLTRAAVWLASSCVQVLRKEPAGRTISPSDSFKFNDKFKCSYRKVRIPMSSLDDSDSPKRVDMV